MTRNKEKPLQIQTKTMDEFFRDPVNSFKRINTNKCIVDNLKKIANQIKISAYLDRYNSELYQNKLIKKTKVRVSISREKNLLQFHSEESMIVKNGDLNLVNEIKEKSENKDSISKFNHSQ